VPEVPEVPKVPRVTRVRQGVAGVQGWTAPRPAGKVGGMRTKLSLSLVVAALVGVAVVPVLAHLSATKSDPAHQGTITASPASVTIWFNQNPVLPVSALTLEGPQGAVKLGEVKAGADRSLTAEVQEPLQPGAHTLTWRTAGNDGHVISGTRTFTFAPAR
jgi:copper resistance protein C